MNIHPILILLLLGMSVFGGCVRADQSGPKLVVKTAGDIDYGTDICAWSGKTIETVRYGAVLELESGERLTFNSAESMARYLQDPANTTDAYLNMWVVDFAAGDRLIPATDAVYLHSPNRPSPGGLRITPIERSNTKMLEYVNRAYPGTYIEWADVLALTQEAE
jgi:hypothetical protein